MCRPIPLLIFVCTAWSAWPAIGADTTAGLRIAITRPPTGPHAIGQDHVAAAEAKIEKALDRLVTVDAVEAPLDRWLDELGRREGINLLPDYKALQDVGFDPASARISTISLRNIPLRSALTILLRQFDLTWIVENEAVMVTTPEEANNRVFVELYNVTDLIMGGMDAGWPDFDPLSEAITSFVHPATWDEAMNTLPAMRLRGAALMAVPQSQEALRDVDDLLRQLRAVVRQKDVKPPRTVPLPPSLQKTEQALDRRVTAHFRGPLDAVLRQIESHAGVNVQPDARLMQDLAICLADVQADFNAQDVPLRQTLEEVLKSANRNLTRAARNANAENDPVELTYTLRDGFVLVTTREEADSDMLVRVYDVSDLVLGDAASGQTKMYPHDIADSIERAVNPESWGSQSGPGAICPLGLPNAYVVVVSQTNHVHRELAAYLARLRVHRGDERDIKAVGQVFNLSR